METRERQSVWEWVKEQVNKNDHDDDIDLYHQKRNEENFHLSFISMPLPTAPKMCQTVKPKIGATIFQNVV